MLVLSPGRPLGDAPVPMDPGVEVFGTPGWLLTPVVLLALEGGSAGGPDGGVAGETPAVPAAEPPGEEGGAAWAIASVADAATEAATNVVRRSLCRMRTSIARGQHAGAFTVPEKCCATAAKLVLQACYENNHTAADPVLERSRK